MKTELIKWEGEYAHLCVENLLQEFEVNPVVNCIMANAIALFGDTKAIKEQIKAMGGRFNPFLNNGGEKQAGWILPATKREAAQLLIS